MPSILLTFALAGVCLGAGQEADKPSTDPGHADSRVAVLCSPEPGVEKLGPLLELELGKKQGIVLLERENIKEIVREQNLQALTAAEGTAKRIALGRLLKADVLVLLQEQEAEKAPPRARDPGASTPEPPRPHARLVICETQQGLRLCNQPVELTANAEADAAAVLPLAEDAVKKQQLPIDDIVAVPPFVDNSLTYDANYLRDACAKSLEGLLMGRPGVVVVELGEAKAIAEELAVSGAGKVQRRLPLYLMGEYRLEGVGDARKASFKLSLQRGTAEIDARQERNVAPEEMPRLVRQAASEILSKALGLATKPPDPKVEVAQLAERARLLTRLGDNREALALTEAALLLDPSRADMHRDAVKLLNRTFDAERLRNLSTKYAVSGEPDSPLERLAKAMLPTALYHWEIYLTNTPLVRQDWSFASPCAHFFGTAKEMPDRESFERYLKEHREEVELVRQMCRRVLAAKAQAKVQDESLPLLYGYWEQPMPRSPGGGSLDAWRRQYVEEHLQEICDARLKLLGDFLYLKDQSWSPLLEIRIDFRPSDTAKEEPVYMAFLQKVATLRNPKVKACVSNILDYDAKIDRIREQGRAAAVANAAQAATKRNAQVQGDPEIAFHEVPLSFEDRAVNPNYCQPLVEGIDLFLSSNDVFLMKQKGELRRLPLKNAAYNVKVVNNVCFDGRFLWLVSPDFAVADPANWTLRTDISNRFLAVVDPRTERTWKFTADDGLPPLSRGGVAALGPGRVCVAGYFGRSWCATADFDPDHGKSLKVFFEAREVGPLVIVPSKDNSSLDNPRLASPVEFLFAATAPGGQGKLSEERVLLGGGGRALLLDPKTGKVLKVLHTGRSLLARQADTVFWAGGATNPWVGGATKENPTPLYRAAFPDFAPQFVPTPPNNNLPAFCLFQKDRVLGFNAWRGEMWTAPSIDKQFRPLRGRLTGYGDGGRYGPQIATLAESYHYGVVVLSGKFWQVEFLKANTP